jgi:hypothetical protein
MRTLLVLCLLLSLAPPAAAQADGAARPLDTATFWLARLRTQYRSAQVHETVTISVEQGVQRASEIVEFASQPVSGFREPEVGVDLGAIELWTRPPGDDEEGPGRVRLAHELDWGSYVEVEPAAGETTLETMRRALPPLMLPHVALALGGPLLPDLGEITWTDVRESAPIADRRTVTLVGETPTARVRMELDTGLVTRIAEMEIIAHGRTARITLSCDANEPFDGRIGYSVRDRERLDGVAQLRARPGDLGPGDPLPDMPLSWFGLSDDAQPTPSYEKRLILFFDAIETEEGLAPEPSVGWDALRRVADRLGAGVRLDPIGVLEFFNLPRDLQNIHVDAYAALDDTPYLYATSEAHSLRRFSADAPACIVVTDRDDRVVGVIPLGDDVLERVEKEGRAAVVSALASEVRSLCGLIDRRLEP